MPVRARPPASIFRPADPSFSELATRLFPALHNQFLVFCHQLLCCRRIDYLQPSTVTLKFGGKITDELHAVTYPPWKERLICPELVQFASKWLMAEPSKINSLCAVDDRDGTMKALVTSGTAAPPLSFISILRINRPSGERTSVLAICFEHPTNRSAQTSIRERAARITERSMTTRLLLVYSPEPRDRHHRAPQGRGCPAPSYPP